MLEPFLHARGSWSQSWANWVAWARMGLPVSIQMQSSGSVLSNHVIRFTTRGITEQLGQTAHQKTRLSAASNKLIHQGSTSKLIHQGAGEKTFLFRATVNDLDIGRFFNPPKPTSLLPRICIRGKCDGSLDAELGGALDAEIALDLAIFSTSTKPLNQAIYLLLNPQTARGTSARLS